MTELPPDAGEPTTLQLRSGVRGTTEQTSDWRISAGFLCEARRSPRSQTITAALFSDRFLEDALVERLRDNVLVFDERGGERHVPAGTFTRLRLLEPQDLSVQGSGVLDGSRGAYDGPALVAR